MVLVIIIILICLFLIFIMFKSYRQNEFNMVGYNIGKYLLGPIFKFYYPYKIINKLDVPASGPVIFCCNHIHFMDQFLTVLESSRPIHYLAKNEYFLNRKTKWFFAGTGCIPVNRSIHDENAKDKAREVLKKGLCLGIFPEGTRNKTKKILLPFKFGAVSLAKEMDAYLIPIAITGHYKFRTKDLKVNFGEAYKIESVDLEKENKILEAKVLSLIKEAKK